MSAEEPTTPRDDAVAVAAADHWRELEGRTGGAPDTESGHTTPQVESGEEKRRKRVLPRRAKIAIPVVLIVFAMAPAWIVVGALTGKGSTPRPQSASGALPANAHRANQRGPSRARWVREPDEATRSRRRHTTPAPRVRRHARQRHEPSHSSPEIPTQPPASGAAPPEPAPEPSPPAPPPAEPTGKPGLRDGATESAEFGL
jgi:hypothetical protein